MTEIYDPVAIQVEDLTNVLYDLNPTTASALVTVYNTTYRGIAELLKRGSPIPLTGERAELIDDLILAITAHGGPRPLSKRTLA